MAKKNERRSSDKNSNIITRLFVRCVAVPLKTKDKVNEKFDQRIFFLQLDSGENGRFVTADSRLLHQIHDFSPCRPFQRFLVDREDLVATDHTMPNSNLNKDFLGRTDFFDRAHDGMNSTCLWSKSIERRINKFFFLFMFIDRETTYVFIRRYTATNQIRVITPETNDGPYWKETNNRLY